MKRFLALLLAVVMLAVSLAACSGDEEKPPESTKAPTDDIIDSTATEANGTDDLPQDLDFGGKEYVIYSIAQTFASGEFFQEESELAGNVIQQAVYDRNAYLEERLHCVLNNEEISGDGETNTDQMLKTAESQYMSGKADYQIYVTAGYRMAPLAQRGFLTNLRNLEYIDFDKDYYSDGYNDILTVGDAQYLATGTFTLGYYRYLMVNLFNKKTFRIEGVEEPYQMVREGKWTFAAMADIATQLYHDLNGDGQTKDDKYGYVVMTGDDSSFTDAFMSACDLHVLTKDEDNYYKVEVNASRYADAIDTVLDLIFCDGTLSGSDLTAKDVYGKFSDGTAAMITTRLYGVELAEVNKLGATDGYGVLPIPKMEDQEDYISYVQDQCFFYGIPSILGGNTLTEVSQLFEAFASASYNIVKPAYYEKALTTRHVFDGNSVEMLDLIGKKVFVDPVNAYLLPGYINTATFRKIYETGINTISSTLASAVGNGALKELVNELNEQYKSLLN